MKNLILFVVAVGMFLIPAVSASAQVTSKPIKFIDNIEVMPGASSGEKTVVADPQPIRKNIQEVSVSPTSSVIEKCSALQFKYAMLLDMEVELITNTKLYNFIDDWMDTRYRYGGTGRDGIDCSAFADTLMNNVYNFNLPRTAREQYDVCKKISKVDLLEGDLVFFNTRGGISHVGVYLGNGFFVHSSSSGVTVSNLSEDYYNNRYVGGGRVSF